MPEETDKAQKVKQKNPVFTGFYFATTFSIKRLTVSVQRALTQR